MKSHRKHAPDLLDSKVQLRTTLHKNYPKRGKKQRLDELKQAIKDFWMYHEWMEDDKGRKAKCARDGHKHGAYRCGWGDKWYVDSFKKAKEKVDTLWQQCSIDGII